MSFQQLKHVSSICHGKGRHFAFVEEWSTKREYLTVYLSDLPNLKKDYKKANTEPYTEDKRITLVDQIPRIRLASCCEAACNCLYSMAEIAAQLANRTSKGALPSSFNSLRKKYESGKLDQVGLENWVSDFTWYKKVRELRTEWVHYSTLFIGEDKEKNPILVVRSHRRISDKEEFKKDLNISIEDICDWIQKAIKAIDRFGDFLLVQYIIPSLDLEAEFPSPKRDRSGFPIFKPDMKLESETITVREHLRRVGIEIKPKQS